MFFPDRIKSIEPGSKVLEVGPGATLHPAATVFLEKILVFQGLVGQGS